MKRCAPSAALAVAEMWTITFKNVLANKARIALITLAVVIGVSFVSSTFIFSDSLSNTFDQLATDVSSGTDLEVRPVREFGSAASLTNDSVDTVLGLDGVRAAGAWLESTDVTPIKPDGTLVDTFSVGLAWITDPEISQFTLVDGAAPGADQFAMNRIAAESGGFVIGQQYDIATPTGVVGRELAGLVAFKGGAAIEATGVITFFPLDQAQTLFGGSPDHVDSLSIAVQNDVAATAVMENAQAELGDQLQVVSQRTVEQERAADFNSQISILRNVLLGFAVVSLFVSTFIIYNTFGIILSQRVRQVGLLRAIGADGSQIGRSVLGEAAIIGLVASVGGLFAGVGLNAGLIALLNALGADFPAMDTIISTRTIALAFAIGLGVTILSALGPARQAGRIAPVVAMSGTTEGPESLGRRVAIGAALGFAGLMLACFGLFSATGTETVLLTLGLGVVAMFCGITLLSPALARPIVQAIGAPVAQFAGASGELARGNASRNRRRTANTAAALMIGLSLITTALVVGQSVKSHLATTLDESVSADFVVSDDFNPMTDQVAERMQSVDELGTVVSVSEIAVKAGGEILQAEAVTFDALGELFDIGISEGSLPSGGRPAAVLSESVATDLGVSVGDSLDVLFDNGTTATVPVRALYTDTTLLESGLMLDRQSVTDSVALSTVDWVAGGVADGAKIDDAQAALTAALSDFPQVDVQTSTEYRQAIEGQIDQLLSIVNVMLALSIVIALIGIGLTLALSVFERTREIGLLRAVGMSTRQVRRMIRWEAALIATFGAVLGVGTGLVYGWGTVAALPDSFVSSVSVPVMRLGLLVVASALAGLIAAMLPARRAARMNVLDAIVGR